MKTSRNRFGVRSADFRCSSESRSFAHRHVGYSCSSISAVSAAFIDKLATMTKHSRRAFADVALSRGTCS
jgi:hypothetical protein